MFDRLVCRTILAEPNAVVRENENRRQRHERGHANGRSHVIAKHQECPAIRADTTMQGEAIEDRAHGVLADTKVQVVAVEILASNRATAMPTRLRIVRWCQISRATNQRRNQWCQCFDYAARSSPRSLGGRSG